MRSHTSLPPLGHSRAAARGGCPRSRSDGVLDERDLLVLELALACLEGTALARALMTMQGVADESEALAVEKLTAASDPAAGAGALKDAIDAAVSFGRADRAEFATAQRWARYVVESRKLARRALTLVTPSGC